MKTESYLLWWSFKQLIMCSNHVWITVDVVELL